MTTTIMTCRSSKTMLQMFSLPMVMTLLLASLIMPCAEAYVYKRSLAEPTTATVNINELTTLEKISNNEELAAPTTISDDLRIATIESKTTTNNKLLRNQTETVVSSTAATIEPEKNQLDISIQSNDGAEESNDILTGDNGNDEISNRLKTPLTSNFELPSSALSEDLEKSIRTDVKNEIEMNQNQAASSTLLEHIITEPELRQQLTDLRIYSQIAEEHPEVEPATTIQQDEEQTKVESGPIASKNEPVAVDSEHDAVESTTVISNVKIETDNESKPAEVEQTTVVNIADVNENLSFVLNEEDTESQTIEPSVDNVEIETNLKELIIENDIEFTTIATISSTHSIIKKEGVELIEDVEPEITTIDSIEEATITPVVIVETVDGGESANDVAVERKEEKVEHIDTVISETRKEEPHKAAEQETTPQVQKLVEDQKVYVPKELTDSSEEEIKTRVEEEKVDVSKEKNKSSEEITKVQAEKINSPKDLNDSSEEDNSSEDKSVEKKVQVEEQIIAKETKVQIEKQSEESDENSKESEEIQKYQIITSTSSPYREISSTHFVNGLEDIAEVLSENENNEGSNKGSRSISSVHGYSDSSAPPNNALNDKLNAESNIGRSQLTNDSNTYNSASGLIIAFFSGIAILLVLIALSLFFVTFRRQHGTLDIELQEQRCGKEDLDEENAETHVKLLEVELPAPSVVTALTTPDDNEECL